MFEFNILSVVMVCGLIALAILLFRMVYLVQQAEAIIIERFGQYNRILGPGMHFVIPFMEAPRSVYWSFFKQAGDGELIRYQVSLHRLDLRECVYDFPKQKVITKDNVTMEISALLYYQITDAKAAVYEISNLPEAIEKLTHATLRNVIGSMDLDESLVSRDLINTRLRLILDEATDKWGVKVNRVELQEVNPPENIRKAMEQQMRAERDRRAVILEAEGAKQAAILKAEGARDAAILAANGESEALMIQASGEARARLTLAEAEKAALTLIQSALPKNDAAAYTIANQYLKTLPQMTSGDQSKLVIIPYESSGMVNSMAIAKELFKS